MLFHTKKWKIFIKKTYKTLNVGFEPMPHWKPSKRFNQLSHTFSENVFLYVFLISTLIIVLQNLFYLWLILYKLNTLPLDIQEFGSPPLLQSFLLQTDSSRAAGLWRSLQATTDDPHLGRLSLLYGNEDWWTGCAWQSSSSGHRSFYRRGSDHWKLDWILLLLVFIIYRIW